MDATRAQSSRPSQRLKPKTKPTDMPIRIYNTLSKQKETFEPVEPGKVGIYLCGPTVYKPSHIGHMVGPVIFDVIKRYLVYSGYDVNWVVNITDVDDKLIKEAGQRGLQMKEVAEEMTADYMQNLDAMGIDTIDHFPKATENIDEIIALISSLIEKDFAYASDGDVYFDVTKDPEYGKLSGRSLDQMQGEGGSTAGRKRSQHDFALWKAAKPDEPSWDSPWGKGRPGWHIECSAMSRKILGETFDIHGGGLDLVFPHHENEIAQSECGHSKPQAKYWMHNGLMQAAGETGKVGGRATREADAGDQEAQERAKISKSTGARPFRELLQEFPAETIRYFLISTHYRRPIYYGDDQLRDAGAALDAFYRYFQRYERVTGESFYGVEPPASREEGEFDPHGDDLLTQVQEHRQAFLTAMDDDFNTGGAIGELNKFLRRLNRYVESNQLEDPDKRSDEKVEMLKQATQTFRELASVLGLFRKPVEQPGGQSDALVGSLMDLLVEIRADLRKEKNFNLADKIRDSLAEAGVILEDRPGGTDWSLK